MRKKGKGRKAGSRTSIECNITTCLLLSILSFSLAGNPYYNRTPVVLIHGMVVASTYLTPLAEQLAPWLQVFAPDLPGTTIFHNDRGEGRA